jgi:hypothetical protein
MDLIGYFTPHSNPLPADSMYFRTLTRGLANTKVTIHGTVAN